MKAPNYQFDRSKQTPKKEYFSGTNVKVYFGDVWVDQMFAIQFAMQEQVTPIYGFNSYKFDKIARGTRLVSGMFSLTFTENGYLQSILSELAEKADFYNKALLDVDRSGMMQQALYSHNKIGTIQKILEIDEPNTYDEYIEDLKNSFWGASSTTEGTVVSSSLSKEYDTFYYANNEKSGYDNILKEHGFNILIDFSPDANKRDFQDCLSDPDKNGSIYRTFRSIMGVQITGESQEISADGQVLRQNYSFIARDLDGDISELSMKHNFRSDTETTYYGKAGSGDSPVASESASAGKGGLSSIGGGNGASGGGTGGGTR